MKIRCSAVCGSLLLASVPALSLGCEEDERGGVSPFDGSVLDAGMDASASHETGPGDASEVGRGDCFGDELSFAGAQHENTSFGAAMRGNRVELVYLITGCGDAPGVSASRELMRVGFGTSGLSDPPAAVGPRPLDSCLRAREVALAASGNRVDLFYSASTVDAPELHHEELLAPAPATPVTSRPELELRLASATLRDSEVATAVFTRELNLERPPHAAAIGSAQPGGADVDVLPETAGHHPTQLAIAAAGGPASEQTRGVIAWVSDLDPHRGIYLRRLGAGGDALGEIVQLTAQPGLNSHLALAAGAVVYTRGTPSDDVHTLVFRSLAEDGSLGTEVVLTSTGQDVAELALTAYGGGYALVYRRQREAGTTVEPTLRLIFLDQHGTPAASRIVATTTPAIAGLQLLAGQDGRLVVIWGDQSDPATDQVAVRARRLLCR